MEPRRQQEEHESRGLAVQVAAIASDVAGVTKSVEVLAHAVESLSERIEIVSHRSEAAASKIGRPDWQAWALFATVILAVVGMVGAGYVRDLSRIEGSQGELVREQRKSEIDAAFERGSGQAKDAELERRITNLDDTLQREMRLSLATTGAGLDALERRISGEVTRETDRLRNRIDAVDEDLKEGAAESARHQALLDLLTRDGAPVRK